MKDDYKFKESTTNIQIEVEAPVAEKLKVMAEFTKMSSGEIANTALKRFIATHKDFFPRDYQG